mmetsp:Transcript_35452/g.71594  ORF Transcript_35452/g.71594 Transcript_35452/m.71594 type:complete len:141 (-) Transcript_35452:228-650(-)
MWIQSRHQKPEPPEPRISLSWNSLYARKHTREFEIIASVWAAQFEPWDPQQGSRGSTRTPTSGTYSFSTDLLNDVDALLETTNREQDPFATFNNAVQAPLVYGKAMRLELPPTRFKTGISDPSRRRLSDMFSTHQLRLYC